MMVAGRFCVWGKVVARLRRCFGMARLAPGRGPQKSTPQQLTWEFNGS